LFIIEVRNDPSVWLNFSHPPVQDFVGSCRVKVLPPKSPRFYHVSDGPRRHDCNGSNGDIGPVVNKGGHFTTCFNVVESRTKYRGQRTLA